MDENMLIRIARDHFPIKHRSIVRSKKTLEGQASGGTLKIKSALYIKKGK